MCVAAAKQFFSGFLDETEQTHGFDSSKLVEESGSL
jgi:hypothetical protein